MPSVSLIITTYKRPKALYCVLDSVARQTVLPDEIMIADDGSDKAETEAVIQQQTDVLKTRIRHVWQTDKGFRAARCRNLAVAQSRADYLIFIDGDCILRPDFCVQHLRLSESRWFVAGQRILVQQQLTQALEAQKQMIYRWKVGQWIGNRRRGQLNRLLPLMNLPGQFWRKKAPHQWKGAKTCNLAVWRKDFIAVNGFDEVYQGWGHEDADLVIRLLHQGVLRKSGRFATAVLHLWHPESDRQYEQENVRRLQQRMLKSELIMAEQGVEQYL